MPPAPGGAATSPDFLIRLSLPRNTVQTTTNDDVFSASADKSPSLTFNLVGRRLLPGETCRQYPSAERPRIGLLLLAAQRERARPNHTGDFAAKKSKRAALSVAPPQLQFHHPPSPGTSLKHIQRVRSRSSKDIVRGAGEFKKVINIIILFYNFFSASRC